MTDVVALGLLVSWVVLIMSLLVLDRVIRQAVAAGITDDALERGDRRGVARSSTNLGCNVTDRCGSPEGVDPGHRGEGGVGAAHQVRVDTCGDAGRRRWRTATGPSHPHERPRDRCCR
ncbi:hypothetical protein [Kocuria kalidii]|uniref:hypothetical protein n=1 Tax=Kocuria kalidii TaxID=3376283 RepID=UPI0037953B90